MSASFNLDWDNSAILDDDNITGQQAVYRNRVTSGSFLSDGFTPDNTMDKDVISAESKALADNQVWQFKVQAICDAGGPTDNSNGVIEQVNFACLVPSIANTHNSSTLSINVAGTDIIKARISLYQSGTTDVLLDGPTIVGKVGSTITKVSPALTPSTGYYWNVDMIAVVNNVEVYSNAEEYLGYSCKDVFTTLPPPTCSPITGLTVSSVG